MIEARSRLPLLLIAFTALCAGSQSASSQQSATPDKKPATAPAVAATAPEKAPGTTKKGSRTSAAPDETPAGGARAHGSGGHGGEATTPPEKTAYDYELPGPDGKGLPVSTYKGKVLLIVNLAHDSMYASQLTGLAKVNDQYKDKCVVVIGVPSNDFGAAEPGTDADLQKFYKVDHKVPFPVMAKSQLTGVQELPFYHFLTGAKTVPENGPVHWNYTKFLVGKDGKVIARFAPDVAPDSPELESTLDQVLAGTYKPVTPGGAGKRGSAAGDDVDN